MSTGVDPMNWMSQIPFPPNTLLWNICLPATHDSGTYALTTALANPLEQDEQDIVDSLTTVADGLAQVLAKIPGASQYIPNTDTWVYEAVIAYLQGILTATYSPVYRQLSEGIRCLDFRVYENPAGGQFYTYHTLVGPLLEDALADLSLFLQSSTAEIVYVTFSHLRNVGSMTDFYKLVLSHVGNHVYVPETGYVNNPFFQTYEQIVTQGSTTPRSRAILVCEADNPPSPFWPIPFNTADNDRTNIAHVVGGSYANSDSPTGMIDDQVSKFGQRTVGSPFALFQILTPQATSQSPQVQNGLGSLLYSSVMQLAQSIISYDPTTSSALATFAMDYIPNQPPAYGSLQQLGQVADGNLQYTVFQRLLAGYTGPNPLSFIYADFYEVSNLVDIATQLSSGPVGGAR